MKKKKTIVVALGGNAITDKDEEGNIYQQFSNTRRSMEGILEMIEMGHRLLITHGNGPQIGNEMIRVELSAKVVPRLPLGVLVGDTQGGMGYMLEQCLLNVMHDRGIRREVACIVTQILVDKHDPALKNPTKFVGPFYEKEKVAELMETHGWIIKEDRGRGWRRVVPSPVPQEIIAKNSIKLLVENNIVVIAAGGGGIPVYVESNGWLEGLDAVIDKDLASAVLGNEVGADELMILTGMEKVALNFGRPDQKFLENMSVKLAKKYLSEGHFPAGSMGPKIQAAVNFLENGGKRVVITSIEKFVAAALGYAGTTIVAE
jgi:carbamate kinase